MSVAMSMSPAHMLPLHKRALSFVLRRRPMVRVADCRSAGPWFKSGGALPRDLEATTQSLTLVKNTGTGWTLKPLQSTKMKLKLTSSPGALPNLQLAPGLSRRKSGLKKKASQLRKRCTQSNNLILPQKFFGCSRKKSISSLRNSKKL